MLKRVEARQGFKQSFEGQAPLFQEAYIRLAVSHQFFLKVKDFVALLLMPRFQGLPVFGAQGFGHIVIEGWDRPHVRLVVGVVELVREVPFAEFCQAKGFGKGGQRHLEKTQ